MPGPWVMNRFFWLCVLAAWCAATRAAGPIDAASYVPVCWVSRACHDGRFPDALAVLVRDGLLDEETLTAPGGRGGEVAYAYIGGQTMDADPRNVLAYEPVGRGGAHEVLFLGGHVARLPQSEVAAAVRATDERLGREGEISPVFRP